MLKKLTLWFMALFASLPITAQNLVLNPGFEQYNVCPTAIGSIAYDPSYSTFSVVKDWVSPQASGSPDYFNTCASPTSGVHIPETQFGYQYARTGNGMVGIIGWHSRYTGSAWANENREYLQCKLLQPLQGGQKYCVSFYVNTSVSNIFNYNYVGLDQIGVNFAPNKVDFSTGTTINLAYHVVNQAGNYVTDTAGWVKVSGVYVAAGGEQWMTVGCFGSGPPSRVTIQTAVPASDLHRSYLFFDDFSVAPINGGDTVISVTDTFSCTSENVSMTLGGNSGNAESYLWSNGAITEAINVTALGHYWRRSVGNCQVHIDTFKLIYDPSKKLSLGRDTGNCFNQPFTIIAPPGFTNLLWSNGGTTPQITVNTSGTYTLRGTNVCGVQIDTIHIHVQPPTAPPVVRDTFLCQFTDQPFLNVQGSSLLWYLSPSSILGSVYVPYINTIEPGNETVYVSQTVGKCESPRVPMNIRIAYQPRKELPDKLTMCEKFAYPIGKQHPEDVDYKWSTGATTCCIVPGHEGLYKLAVSNECGTYIDTVRIIFSTCDVCVTAPNAFTPNNDGSNDKFKAIVTCPLDGFQLSVYNRWGNKVFDSRNPDEAWDGTYNGQPCDEGTYIYVIQYRSQSTFQINKLSGSIHLLR